MGSLSSYPRLKRLAIPEHFLITGEDLFMAQLLPPNLEELQEWLPEDVHLLSTIQLSNRRLKYSAMDVNAGWWGLCDLPSTFPYVSSSYSSLSCLRPT